MAYWTLPPVLATTSFQSAISFAIRSRNCRSLPPAGATPSVSSCAAVSLRLSILFTSALMRSTTGRRRVFGPIRPCHSATSKPGTPDSTTAGTSGSAGRRLGVGDAGARGRPERAGGSGGGGAPDGRWGGPGVGAGGAAVLEAEEAGGAGAVIDDDRRAERFGEPLRGEASDEIGAAAGGERHDDVHRLRRILLLRHGRRARHQREG